MKDFRNVVFPPTLEFYQINDLIKFYFNSDLSSPTWMGKLIDSFEHRIVRIDDVKQAAETLGMMKQKIHFLTFSSKQFVFVPNCSKRCHSTESDNRTNSKTNTIENQLKT